MARRSSCELYNECRPESFEAVIRDVFGVDIDALEAEFWKDAIQQVNESQRRQKGLSREDDQDQGGIQGKATRRVYEV